MDYSLHCVTPNGVCHTQTNDGSHPMGEEILDVGMLQRPHYLYIQIGV